MQLCVCVCQTAVQRVVNTGGSLRSVAQSSASDSSFHAAGQCSQAAALTSDTSPSLRSSSTTSGNSVSSDEDAAASRVPSGTAHSLKLLLVSPFTAAQLGDKKKKYSPVQSRDD